MPTGYEVGMYNSIDTIAAELTRIRKLLDRLVTYITQERPDPPDEPQAEDVDL